MQILIKVDLLVRNSELLSAEINSHNICAAVMKIIETYRDDKKGHI